MHWKGSIMLMRRKLNHNPTCIKGPYSLEDRALSTSSCTKHLLNPKIPEKYLLDVYPQKISLSLFHKHTYIVIDSSSMVSSHEHKHPRLHTLKLTYFFQVNNVLFYNHSHINRESSGLEISLDEELGILSVVTPSATEGKERM